MKKIPEYGEDGVVGGEGNGYTEAGRHEEKQEKGRPSAKPFIFGLFSETGTVQKGVQHISRFLVHFI